MALAFAAALLLPGATSAGQGDTAPVDPGLRGGPAAAGGPLHGLDAHEIAFFEGALAQFRTVDSVSGTLKGETGAGLGPRFNGTTCANCHAFPAIGGSSPHVNPQVADATKDGARNTLPSFVTIHGPVREARFVAKPDGTPDGSVHPLFVITGRSDAPGCTITQPDFAAEQAKGNVALRIPNPLFGLGLVEGVSDAALRAEDAAHAPKKQALGIAGHFNTSTNDATITRFGWKAQDKSLLMFSGEAYNVEQGVTNELFPNETETAADCRFNALPEDATALTNGFHSGSPASDFSSGTVNFAAFMRLSAPPEPAPETDSTRNGRKIFKEIGCEACHFESQTTGQSLYTNQSNVTFHPYSDFELHAMGTGLADGIVEGDAAGDEFRTQPLWGLGKRIFFLHDGRTKNLIAAIAAHRSAGSEANGTLERYDRLSAGFKQDLVNFLRSL
jgi:CxxC motif-containing protein (DUF1111 family)